MRAALEQAAHYINLLQDMAEPGVPAKSREVFFLHDVEEAVGCAERATRQGEAYQTCLAWKVRMDTQMHEATRQFQAFGVVECLHELTKLWGKLQALHGYVDRYLEQTSEPMGGFDDSIISEVKMYLENVKRHVSPHES